MSILKDSKNSEIFLSYIQATTDHITPCSRMRARGNYFTLATGSLGNLANDYTPFHFTLNRDCTSRIAGMVKGRKWC